MGDESISTSMTMDTSNYKAGVSEMNRQIRVLETGFRASVASMDDWTKSASGLEERNKTLAQTMDLQKQKVNGLNQVYEEMVSSGSASNKELEEMQVKINKASEELGRSEKEFRLNEDAIKKMGDESNTTGDKLKDLGDKENDTAGKTVDFKERMQGVADGLKIMSGAILGIAGAVAGIGGALGKLVTDSAGTADGLDELSWKTGISVEKLQEMDFIGKQVGTSTETIAKSMAKLTKSMDGARGGTGDAAEAFKKLNVSVLDSKGQLRDSEDVFADALNAMGGMSNETERDAISMAIFGKSAQELNPLISTTKEALVGMKKQAHELGAVVDDDTIVALGDFNDTLDGLKSGLKGISMTVAAAFLPAFKGIAEKLTGYMGELAGIVTGSDGDLGKMASGIGGLVSKIALEIASEAPKMLTAGLGILQGIINGLLGNLPTLLPAVIQMVTSIVNFIVQNLPTLITAAIQIITALATGLAQALPTLIPAIVGAIPLIIDSLLTNLPLLIGAALQILIALAEGIVAALPILIDAAPKILNELINAIKTSLPMLGDAALKIIFTLANGITDNLPAMKKSAQDMIKAFVKGANEINNQILAIGKNIVDGVWQGIQNNYQRFYNNVMDFFQGIVGAVHDVLDINSPSRVFAKIGSSMVEGLDLGFTRDLSAMETKMRNAASSGFGIMNQLGLATGSMGNQATYNFFGSVNLAGAAGQSIGQMIEAKRF